MHIIGRTVLTMDQCQQHNGSNRELHHFWLDRHLYEQLADINRILIRFHLRLKSI